MNDTRQVLLQHHLKKLKLPTFQSEYAKLARQCAAERRDHVQYLLRLCELELIERERRMIERRIKAAKFPTTKSLDSFDFKAIPSLNKVLTLELARCAFVERRENIIALGPSGTGKTHVALGLGLAACQKGLKVRFTTAAALVHELIEATDERRLQRLQKTLAAQAGISKAESYLRKVTKEYEYKRLSETSDGEYLKITPNAKVFQFVVSRKNELHNGEFVAKCFGTLDEFFKLLSQYISSREGGDA